MKSVPPIPPGYHTATPYLVLQGAAQAIAFYQKAFGATEMLRLSMPGGGVAHAEIKIGDSVIMLADEVNRRFAEMMKQSPKAGSESPAS